MKYRLLGPLDVLDEGGHHLVLGGARQQSVLASLLLRAGQTVTLERLVTELWEVPPETAVKTVQVYVSRLRHELPRRAIESRPGGYTLVLASDDFDLEAFQHQAEEGRAALEAGDHQRAVDLLEASLALWRGPALAGLGSEALRREADRLEEQRLRVLEDRHEAYLRCGREREVVPSLQAFVHEHPFRERARAQLMLALHRSGRSRDALAVYRDTRGLFVEELGMEPGQELRDLEQAILRQDLGLDAARPKPPASPGPAEPKPILSAAQAWPGEVRKTVTVLFSDLVDSSELGRRLDAEALRRVMSRYFAEMRAVLERHGGRVEKYIGDAVMAAFGLPVLHEDDALRAVRAAVEMREQLGVLNAELERAWGLRLAARIGVNTGEVIAGAGTQDHFFVTGEAVNIAKRLEEVAEESEILIGVQTLKLVRDAVRVERVAQRTAKGGEAIPAFRVVEVVSHTSRPARRFDSPLVGRDRQLASLRSAFTNAVTDRACHLFTVLGSAGVGKSRLVEEFVSGLGNDAIVLRGRCLPYGEGITYWPVAEVLREAAGGGAQETAEQWLETITAHLDGEPKAELIAERLAEAVGFAVPSGKSEETFWAVRKLFEALARRRALVVVLDDLQWAESTMLDLVEHLADFSRDAPLLILCMARPEVLDERPGWGGGKLNASSILLEPLADSHCRQLIANLVDEPLSEEVEGRIALAAEGSPLFAEELLAMLIEDELLTKDGGRWRAAGDLAEVPVPPTIHALLAARLERLPHEERKLITRASIEGAVFHRSAVRELAAGSLESSIDDGLMELVRKDVIRPERADFADDEAFRFRHVLIRDAAYGSLPKETRADLHERAADWLERAAGPRLPEFEEIVGYHLEQAYRFCMQLGKVDETTAVLGVRAGRRLGDAGRRALARGDVPGALNLLERAASLLSESSSERVQLLPALAEAATETGDLSRADRLLREVVASAAAAGDRGLEAFAQIDREHLGLYIDPATREEQVLETAEGAIRVFTELGNDRGLARALSLRAQTFWARCSYAAMEEVLERALVHAERAEDDRCRSHILTFLARGAHLGPISVVEGLRRCESIYAGARGEPALEAVALAMIGALKAQAGAFEEARASCRTSRAISEEFGLGAWLAALPLYSGPIELLAGDPEAAEHELRSGYDALSEMGELGKLSTEAAFLAQALYAQGRYEEAEYFTGVGERATAFDDVFSQVAWRGVRAKTTARKGDLEQAERLAREAVALAEETDGLNLHGDALLDFAEVLRAARRPAEARAAAGRALELYERKGNVVSAARARASLGGG
jgi:class 3 adenylate cyclase/DNA-binding SARP family transcriptional activator/tetratricopeptide (TPR) repeat protein